MSFDKSLVDKMKNDPKLEKIGIDFIRDTLNYKYSFNFTWLGRSIIQFPQDIIAIQEIIWKVKPDLIIETGIAHGGSLIFSASILELIGKGEVLGIDIDIREHHRKEIENHPMYKRITMMEGSSIDYETINKVHEFSKGKESVLLFLDSNHTHDHVLKELNAYSPLIKKGNYLVVFDTCIEDLPDNCFPDKPWSKGNNPKTAVWEFLKNNDRFEIDNKIENKILITVSPDGYLKCIKD